MADHDLSRRQVFKQVGAAISITPVAAAALQVTGADAVLLQAEREVVVLLDRIRSDYSNPACDAMLDRVFALDKTIAQTPPTSLAGAAAKLRRLLDPELGIATGEGVGDVESLTQVLAVVEQTLAGGNA